jgi:DUF971 family protein
MLHGTLRVSVVGGVLEEGACPLLPVSQYALQLGFASGHGTGIYTFRYLRALGA